MAVIYWFSDGAGVDVVKGGPNNDIAMPTILIRWNPVASAGSSSCRRRHVQDGKPAEFDEFLKQMDGDVTKNV